MATAPHILIVDDDEDIRQLIAEFLTSHGFVVTTEDNGLRVLENMADSNFDLIILDIMMPEIDGLSLCRKLRKLTHTPIMMVTAMDEDIDRVAALELGADDYLTKPFNTRVLLAQVKALLRRSSDYNQPTLATTQDIYEFENWQLDQSTHRLTSPDKVDVTLSTAEFDLLLAFVQQPKRVLSREQLVDLTHNRGADPFDRSIDVLISRLRQKIETNPKSPEFIKTVRNAGYMFASPVRHYKDDDAS